MSRPSVTILVPTFNRDKFLAQCLDSLLVQTLPAVQILVVNDGSTDDTDAVLAPYRARIDTLETPQIGKPGSINAGLKIVRGEYLWIFDDDDVAFPDALERFVEPLEKDPSLGYSYSTYFYADSHPKTYRIGKILGEYRIPDLDWRGYLGPLLEANYLGGAALFARTSCYDTVGLFDDKLLRSQDYEMAIRIARRFRGAPVRGGATFYYRQHGELRGPTADRFECGRKLLKWLEYDQIFFRAIYKSLPLEEYAPARSGSPPNRRLALFQRFSIMVNKHLVSEALTDLEALAALEDRSPMTAEEMEVLRVLMTGSWYYSMRTILDEPEIVDAIRRYSKRSAFIGFLRSAIFVEAARINVLKPNPKRLLKSFRSARLFFNATSGRVRPRLRA